MDESLKARLIGAAVLVAVAVILIPELLTGRGPAHASVPASGDRGTRTIIIDVPVAGATASSGSTVAGESAAGATASTTSVQPPAAEAGAMLPEPAATLADTNPGAVAAGVTPSATSPQAANAAAPAATNAPAATATPPAATTQPTPKPAPPPPAVARGAWAVQVGAFGSTAAAEKVVNELRSAGFRAYVSPVQRGGKTLYRVRVGPEPERPRADALAATLKGRGLPATVVAND